METARNWLISEKIGEKEEEKRRIMKSDARG